MGVKYSIDHDGIGDLLCAEFLIADMERRANAVKAEAIATAPVATTGQHRGRYAESFEVTSGVREGKKTRRAYGRVTNWAPEAVIVEFGNKNTPRHATLRRALESAAGA
jgi:hypothetical protein